MSKRKEQKEKYLFNSEYIFIENILILFLSLPFLLIPENDVYSYLLYISFVYLTTVLLFRRIYFYSEYLIILYPTRFIFRKQKINYSDIKKIKYIYGKSAYDKPEIHIKYKNKWFFHFYVSLNRKKRKEVLTKLSKLGLEVEIKSLDWEDNRMFKEKIDLS